MRTMFANRVTGTIGTERDLLDLAFGGFTATPITDAFFAVCRAVADLDKDEQAIEACLRKAIRHEIERRNNVVHGDWIFERIGDSEHPVLIRINAASVKEPFRIERYDAKRIEGMCADVEALHNAAWEFAAIIFGAHGNTPYGPMPERIRDALEVVDKRVVFRAGVAIPSWNL